MKYLKANIDKPITFVSAGDFTADDKWRHMNRIIDNYEIIIINKGTVYIQQDEEKYELQEGDLLLLEPGRTHKGYAFSNKGTSFYWMHFNCDDFSEIISHEHIISKIAISKNNHYFNGLNNNISIPTYAKKINLDKITVLFHQLLHLSQTRYYTSQGVNYIITSLLIEITDQIISNFNIVEKDSVYDDKLPKILEWIRIHMTQNISLKDVAYEFNFSKEYLARYFKKEMGMSMQEYINNMRISYGKQLLCNSDKNIKEIAYMLGFVDEKYFFKLFKKYEKLTPKQFRKTYNMTFLNNI